MSILSATSSTPLATARNALPLPLDYLRLMSTPNHRRHFGTLGATASGIKVSSGGRELLSGIAAARVTDPGNRRQARHREEVREHHALPGRRAVGAGARRMFSTTS